ncbi:MAG: hypothetical protein HC806_08350 [Anaerolineae bacterium]|nr:hypothetical protein [Anaerolineae bacterium]
MLDKGPDSQENMATSHLTSIVKEMAIALHVIETGQILALETTGNLP